MRSRMRRMNVLIAMVVLSSLVLVYFYRFPFLQTPQNRRSLLEDSSVNPTVQHTDIPLLAKRDHDITSPPKRESIPQTPIPVSTTRSVQKADQKVFGGHLSVSDSFRKAVPQDKAFWNRKMGWLLKQLDKGEYSAEKYKVGWLDCRETNHDLLRTNMHDFGAYPELHQDFLRGMDCRDPPITINQPNKCSTDGGDGHTFLLLAIKSTANNFEERQVVRETWGKEGTYEGGLRVRTVFLLGGSTTDDADLSRLLSFEAEHFGDVLQWDFYDTFFNLTLKEHVFYRWAREHCPNVSFVFKGDDDVFVNTPAILSYLQSLTPDEASKSYIGHIIYSASPLRNPQSKYFVPLTFYNGPYPPYAGGGGYLFSGGLIESLYHMSHLIPLFPIDDVYTGMCFQALGITPKAHPAFQTFDIQEQDRENLCIHKSLLLVHKRSPKQLKKLWRGVNSPLLTC